MHEVRRIAIDVAKREGWDDQITDQVLADYVAFLKSGGKLRPPTPESVHRLQMLRSAFAGGDLMKEMTLARRLVQ